MKRCKWCLGSDLEMEYHDNEWGKYDPSDHRYFEYLMLECFQTGLSWKTILFKRDSMNQVFYQFDFNKISECDDDIILEWMEESNIIKSPRKLAALINNSIRYKEILNEFVSFDSYLKTFVPDMPVRHDFNSETEIPSKDEVSTSLAKDLKQRGFKFVGPVTMYAFLQASGVYNDHIFDCSFGKKD